MLVRVPVVFLEPQEILSHALMLNLERGIVCHNLIELSLERFLLKPEGSHSLISILLDFIHANDLTLEGLRFLEEVLVHLLHLLLLQLVLLFQCQILLQSQLEVRFFARESID